MTGFCVSSFMAMMMAGELDSECFVAMGGRVVEEVECRITFPVPVNAGYAQGVLQIYICKKMQAKNYEFDFYQFPLDVVFLSFDNKSWRLRYEFAKGRKPRGFP